MIQRKKILVVYNPRSGRKKKWHAWYALRQYLPASFYELERLDLLEEPLAERLQRSQYGLLAVIGGDGTLRAVVDCLMRSGISIPLIIVPRGSANLVAKSLGIPKPLGQIARVIEEGKEVAIDIARLSTGDYFVGAFAMGYLSHRVTTVRQHVKRHLGFLGYLISFLTQLRLPLHTFTISANGTTFTEQGHSLFVVNTANVFGFRSRRFVSFTDGVFELVVTKNRSLLSFWGLVYDFYFRRTEPRHFVLHRGARFSISTPDTVSIQIDGEQLQPQHRYDIEVLPQRQHFIVP